MQIPVEKVGDQWFVSDDGVIARKLGVTAATRPLGFLVTQGGIGPHVEVMTQMLIKLAQEKSADGNGRTVHVDPAVRRGFGDFDDIGDVVHGDPVTHGSASTRDVAAVTVTGDGQLKTRTQPPKGVSQREHNKSRKGRKAQRNGKKLSLDDLGLNKQQLWRLKSAKVTTVAKLAGLTEAQLSAKKGVGPAIVKAVKKGLKKNKLRLTAKVG